MDETRFEAIVSAYGADPKKWPADERAAAEAFAAAHPELLREARGIDALLNIDARALAPSDLLQARILRARRMHAPVTWRPAAALAACALLGLAVGYGGVMTAAPHPDVADALLSSAFGDLGGDAG